MNIIDSSAWLTYFAGEPQAKYFLELFNDQEALQESLIVPTITLYEVFKVVLREASENEAFKAIAAMKKGKVVDLTPSLALSASKLSLKHKLPMADSIILATAKLYNAVVWTLDSDFQDIKGVKYFPKNG
ncbi:PilT protein [Desulfosarcina cetonica]|uniref:type II toxin-antitoxin system VapC family toxin n=1 Tax=Desulfosarcina cetonica TaxID=90730 RepID=UPI0006D11214|nr:type II toxin-antitoxin system VapC family toxin [Desulfosarcina cetonica]VTR68019.1 PilT protein [Desulfosarcina cetonica]